MLFSLFTPRSSFSFIPSLFLNVSILNLSIRHASV
jgi:hypothetical protein